MLRVWGLVSPPHKHTVTKSSPPTHPPTSACSKKKEEKKEERKSPKILHSNHRSTCSLRLPVSSSLSEKVLMPVTRSIRSESQNVDREKEKLLWAVVQHRSSLPTSYTPEKNTHKHTHTYIYTQNQLLPKSLLYVGSVYVFLKSMCVYVCGLCCASRMPRDELAAWKALATR